MHRGKAIQPHKGCEYCNEPLPALRHPKAVYCNSICRERARYARRNITKGVPCLVCGKSFVRVGSHVVQVHGYENVLEYRHEFGLMSKETRDDKYAKKMQNKVVNKSISNLHAGASNRYQSGGDHGERLREFWQNRKVKKGYVKVSGRLGNR